MRKSLDAHAGLFVVVKFKGHDDPNVALFVKFCCLKHGSEAKTFKESSEARLFLMLGCSKNKAPRKIRDKQLALESNTLPICMFWFARPLNMCFSIVRFNRLVEVQI
jgi:hypothetical protein